MDSINTYLVAVQKARNPLHLARAFSGWRNLGCVRC